MKHSSSTSSGTKKTSYLDKVWKDIEIMPIWYWIRILETADLKYLFREEKGTVTKKVGGHWLGLQQEYIEEFGLDETFVKQMSLKKQLVQFNMDFVLTGERFLLNMITIIERDIETANSKEGAKFYDQVDAVEKYKGFEINPKVFPVKKWYWALKNMSNG